MGLSAVLIKQRGGQGQLFGGCAGAVDLAEVFGDQRGAEIAVDKLRVLEQVGQQLLVARHAQQHRVLHGAQQLAPRLLAGGAMGDDLAEQRVIERADALAFENAVVDPHARGRFPAQHRTGLRQKALGRVFGVQAYFHGVAAEADLRLL